MWVRSRGSVILSSRLKRAFSSSPPHLSFHLSSFRSTSTSLSPRFYATAAQTPLPPLHADPNIPFPETLKSVVKVYTEYKDPYWSLPWQMLPQRQSSGSGFAIEGRFLLTNAHCIANHTRVLVRKPGDPRKFKAEVVAEGHECDLALLTVQDPEFWKNVSALPLGDLPSLQDSVVVLGYPTGGDNLCVTSGVVSRVDVSAYAHSDARLLCTQIDAAVNPGNSGGPAFTGNKVVGVAFQGFDDAQNIGYIIPIPVVKRFLRDVFSHNGQFAGFSVLGVTFQALENEYLRKLVGIDGAKDQLPPGISASGVRVLLADPFRRENALAVIEKRIAMVEGSREGSNFPALDNLPQFKEEEGMVGGLNPDLNQLKRWRQDGLDGVWDSLQRDDVIMAVDDYDVADDGTICLRGGGKSSALAERVHLSHALLNHFTGSSIRVTVLREGKVEVLKVPVVAEGSLFGGVAWGKLPRFSIWGGLVFVPLTVAYLKSEYGRRLEGVPVNLQQYFLRSFKDFLDEEIVILSHILASDLTIGYEWKNMRLWKINGTHVRNLRHAVEMLEEIDRRCAAGEGDYLVRFELDFSVELVMDAREVAKRQENVLERHGIPFNRRL